VDPGPPQAFDLAVDPGLQNVEPGTAFLLTLDSGPAISLKILIFKHLRYTLWPAFQSVEKASEVR